MSNVQRSREPKALREPVEIEILGEPEQHPSSKRRLRGFRALGKLVRW